MISFRDCSKSPVGSGISPNLDLQHGYAGAIILALDIGLLILGEWDMSESENGGAASGNAALPLLILRLATGYFMLLWAIEKLIKPEGAVGIFGYFYGMEISTNISVALGIVQTIIVICFLVGFMRRLSYGLVLLMHAVSTLATWKHLVDPFGLYLLESPQHLFFAAVPVLAGTWLLYALRDQDTYSLEARLGTGKG